MITQLVGDAAGVLLMASVACLVFSTFFTARANFEVAFWLGVLSLVLYLAVLEPLGILGAVVWTGTMYGAWRAMVRGGGDHAQR